MKSVRFRLRPLAGWATPWQADSLFGALCWELARAAGEPALARVLDHFRKGPPPFLLSDAFPADLLPRPLCAAGDDAAARFVSRDQFVALRRGEPLSGDLPRQRWWRTLWPWRTFVPRDGSDPVSFPGEEFAWRPEVPEQERFLSLYARADEPWLERLAALLRSLGRSGFGKRSTTGRGAFELVGQAERCEWLEPLPFENAFVSLSHFVPEEGDPCDGRWDTLVKYPKLGSERGASHSPLKGRLVMLRPGSCFRPMGRPRRWYGCVLTGLSAAFPDAVHYGLAYAVGIRWDLPRAQ